MKYIAILTLFILSWVSSPAQVQWLSFEEAVAKTKENPKPIFIDVFTDWCGWCKKMDAATFQEENVAKVLQNDFYPVKFNAEQRASVFFNDYEFKFIENGRRGYNELAVALLDGKLSYPSVVFFNTKMERITVLAGYRNAKDFLPILNFIASEAYLSQTFDEFVNQESGK